MIKVVTKPEAKQVTIAVEDTDKSRNNDNNSVDSYSHSMTSVQKYGNSTMDTGNPSLNIVKNTPNKRNVITNDSRESGAKGIMEKIKNIKFDSNKQKQRIIND
jgi:hypothetical protein